MKDTAYRQELLKRHILGLTLYDEGNELNDTNPPFVHSKDDKLFIKAYQLKYLQRTVLADTIGDLDNLNVQFGKEDFDTNIPEMQRDFIESNKYMKEYMEKKGGKLKCGSLGYLQGNFGYYYSQKNSFIDECMKEVGTIAKTYPKIMDYSSGEEDDIK